MLKFTAHAACPYMSQSTTNDAGLYGAYVDEDGCLIEDTCVKTAGYSKISFLKPRSRAPYTALERLSVVRLPPAKAPFHSLMCRHVVLRSNETIDHLD
jgi:hypothetical protein